VEARAPLLPVFQDESRDPPEFGFVCGDEPSLTARRRSPRSSDHWADGCPALLQWCAQCAVVFCSRIVEGQRDERLEELSEPGQVFLALCALAHCVHEDLRLPAITPMQRGDPPEQELARLRGILGRAIQRSWAPQSSDGRGALSLEFEHESS
jgi:hypothetical protein